MELLMAPIENRRQSLAVWVLETIIHRGPVRSTSEHTAEQLLFGYCGFPETTAYLDACLGNRQLAIMLLQAGGSATLKSPVTLEELQNVLNDLEQVEYISTKRNNSGRVVFIIPTSQIR
jgi:hypothetical protein